jgi:hypothetical protein
VFFCLISVLIDSLQLLSSLPSPQRRDNPETLQEKNSTSISEAPTGSDVSIVSQIDFWGAIGVNVYAKSLHSL